MGHEHLQRMNLNAPNVIVVCVDRTENGDIGGRFYHCYERQPENFTSIVEFMTRAERIF